jgi:hypothetical protein
MMNKTKVNYWVDLVIALAFVFSAVSGIVFLFPMSGSTVLGVTYKVWDQIHTWGSLLMIGGVLAHLILHWKWIIAMTKKTFFPQATPARTAITTNGSLISRRQFLRTAGLGVVALGTAAVSYKTLFGSDLTEDSPVVTDDNVVQSIQTVAPLATVSTQSISVESLPAPEVQVVTNETVLDPTNVQPTAVPATATSIPLVVVPTESTITQMTVACHKGITYDPYPGKCRHYVDNDGDGYCDYSIPT